MDLTDQNKLNAFIGTLLMENGDRTPFNDSDSLIKSGRLDSLAVTKIVMFLETHFNVDFARVEFDPERLDTVAGIAAVIEESRSA